MKEIDKVKKEYEKFRIKQDRKYILSIDEIYKKVFVKELKWVMHCIKIYEKRK